MRNQAEFHRVAVSAYVDLSDETRDTWVPLHALRHHQSLASLGDRAWSTHIGKFAEEPAVTLRPRTQPLTNADKETEIEYHGSMCHEVHVAGID